MFLYLVLATLTKVVMERLQCASSPAAMVLFLGLTHAVELSRVSSFSCPFPFPCRLDKVSCSPINLPLRTLALLCVPMSEEEWIRSRVVFSYSVVPKPGTDWERFGHRV